MISIKDIETKSIAYEIFHMRDQLARHVYNRSEAAFIRGDKARDEALKCIESFEKRRLYIKNKFIENLGGLPSSDTPLNARVTGTVQCSEFKIEKIIYESRPKAYVTANIYIPDGISKPTAAILFLSGHHMEAKSADEYQNVCQYLVKSGLVVLAIDPIGQGERFSYCDENGEIINWGCVEHEYAGMQAMLAGMPTARFFVHDAMRGIDYLLSRKEVDSSKIGVTGNSGGGTQTSLMMMCDDRIAAAAPATFIMDRQTYMYTGQAQDSEQIWPGMTEIGFDHEDLIMAIAPKPVLVLSVNDDFFPIESTKKTFERATRAWDLYGCRQNTYIYIDRSEHHYTDNMAARTAAFFSKHLLNKEIDIVLRQNELLPSKTLWCTRSGQVRLDYPDVHFVHEEILRKCTTKTLNCTLEEAKEKLHILIEKDRVNCPPVIRTFRMGQYNHLVIDSCVWWSQKGIMNHAYVVREKQLDKKALPVSVGVWDNGTRAFSTHLNWIYKECAKGRVCVIIDTTGTGNIEPDDLCAFDNSSIWGTLSKLADDLIWLGDSVAAIRMYDIKRLFEILPGFYDVDTTDVTLYTYGKHSIYPRIAALVYDNIPKPQVESELLSLREIACSKYYDFRDMMSIVIPGLINFFDIDAYEC